MRPPDTAKSKCRAQKNEQTNEMESVATDSVFASVHLPPSPRMGMKRPHERSATLTSGFGKLGERGVGNVIKGSQPSGKLIYIFAREQPPHWRQIGERFVHVLLSDRWQSINWATGRVDMDDMLRKVRVAGGSPRLWRSNGRGSD